MSLVVSLLFVIWDIIGRCGGGRRGLQTAEDGQRMEEMRENERLAWALVTTIH